MSLKTTRSCVPNHDSNTFSICSHTLLCTSVCLTLFNCCHSCWQSQSSCCVVYNFTQTLFLITEHWGVQHAFAAPSQNCVRGEGVQGVLTLFSGGAAQTCHDDRAVELKEQLGVEEVNGEGQEGKVKEEGRDRVKENAPWMTWR